MRMLMKIRLPVANANRLVLEGKLASTMGRILEEVKPEAAYFGEEDGMRTGYLDVDIEGLHKIPAVAEPWFLAFDAKISLHPVMVEEDLRKAAPDIEAAARNYGR